MLPWQGKFEAMRVLLLVRLGEEESAGIPLMRKHFTHAEIRPVSTRGSWPTCQLAADHSARLG